MLHREHVRFVYNVQANPCELGYSTLRVLLRSTRRLRLRTSTQPTCSLVVVLPHSMYSSVQYRARKLHENLISANHAIVLLCYTQFPSLGGKT